MVEYSLQLDLLFGSLADATRRDILKRVAKSEQSIRELAGHYHMTFAGIAKHIAVLEKATLIEKRRKGRQQIISANPKAIALSQSHLKKYQQILADRYVQLDNLLDK